MRGPRHQSGIRVREGTEHVRGVGASTPRPDAPVGVPGRLAEASDLQIDGVPPINVRLFEFPHPDFPYGLDGVGEPPTLPSTPAIVNALRNATGLDPHRVPVRPPDLIRRSDELRKTG